MINLSKINKALTDERLSDKDFRVLYFILNNISLNNGSAKIHNARLMEMFNLSKSQVNRITRKLCETEYIQKTKSNSNDGCNVYIEGGAPDASVNEGGALSGAQGGAPDDTPKKNIKKTKENINILKEPIGTSTGTDEHEESYKRVEVQRKRIDKWNDEPQLVDYPTITADGFLDEADWFEKDIRNNLTEDEWYSLADYFNRVKDKYIKKYSLRAA